MTFEDPDQSPLTGLQAQILRNKWASGKGIFWNQPGGGGEIEYLGLAATFPSGGGLAMAELPITQKKIPRSCQSPAVTLPPARYYPPLRFWRDSVGPGIFR